MALSSERVGPVIQINYSPLLQISTKALRKAPAQIDTDRDLSQELSNAAAQCAGQTLRLHSPDGITF